jgi:hypothetical protein
MSKSTVTYWNPLNPDSRGQWTPIKGLEGMVEELTLSIDNTTGEYTRLTRFLPGADTSAFGGKAHPYPEEVFIVSGRLHDHAFDLCWKRVTTPAALQLNVMGHSAQMLGALCWRCRFQTVSLAMISPNIAFERDAPEAARPST